MVALSQTVLRAPPWLITLLWVAPFVEAPLQRLPRYLAFGVTVAPVSWSMVCTLIYIAWEYALYEESRSRTPPALRDQHGRRVFAIATAGMAVLIPLATFLYEFEGQPPDALVATAGILIVIAGLFSIAAIGYAANAFHKAQMATGQEPEWHPLLALLFIGIGIWFIHRPIQDILAQPKDHAP